ncbi:MAG: hypothetical protein K8R88_07895 [Armatimonadetes bacterium]|nr:hypothetical protein [Armatimonadota bacterium]
MNRIFISCLTLALLNFSVAGAQTKKSSNPFDSVKHVKGVLKAYDAEEKQEKQAKKLKGQKSSKNSKGPGEEEKGDYLRAWLYCLERRAFPNDSVNWSAYETARTHIQEMPSAAKTLSRGNSSVSLANPGAALSGQFEFTGPKNLDVPYQTYYGVRPTTGRVGAVAYDPSNTETLYLGGANGGVWKSTNNGSTWIPLTDDWDVMQVSALAVDPQSPNTIYAGTGDFHGGGGFANGIMKSMDGGQSWARYGQNEFGASAVSQILIDPDNTQVITVTTGNGPSGTGKVWRSTDGGASWLVAINVNSDWSDATIGGPVGARVYYAVGNGNQVWTSRNQGLTWTRLNAGVSGVLGVAASPTNGNTVYLLATGNNAVLKSADGGLNWSNTTNNLNANWGQAWYDYHIRCGSAGGQDIVYVGLIDIFKSGNGGTTWASVGGPTDSGNAITHNDQHCLAINPNNANQAFLGNDGGAYLLNGTSIVGLSNTLGLTMFYNADWHPTDPNRMIGGTQDNATPVAVGDLGNWLNVAGGDGGFVAIHQRNPLIQYATIYGFTIIQTKDGWKNQREISPNTGNDNSPFVTCIASDPLDADVLYGGTNYVWKYAGGKWIPRLGNQKITSNSVVTAIASGFTDYKVIYAGSGDGQLWMSWNSGETWTKISGGLPQRAITSISVSPTNAFDVLVTLSGTGSSHVYQCSYTPTGGRVWKNVSGASIQSLPDVPFNSIGRDPKHPERTWYAGSDLGLFATIDGGKNWSNATVPLGLPNTNVSTVKATPGTGFLNVATYGRGMWRIPLGIEVRSTADAIVASNGAITSGVAADLPDYDGESVNLLSSLVKRTGQLAGISGKILVGKPAVDIYSVTIDYVAGGNAVGYQSFLLKNVKTGKFEPLSTVAMGGDPYVGSITLKDAKAAKYVTANGTVEYMVRGYVPAGTIPFQYNVDQVVVTSRVAP